MDKCWRNPAINVKDTLIRSEMRRERRILHQTLAKEKEKGRCMLMLQRGNQVVMRNTKSFIVYVNISDKGEMSKASEANFSTYS